VEIGSYHCPQSYSRIVAPKLRHQRFTPDERVVFERAQVTANFEHPTEHRSTGPKHRIDPSFEHYRIGRNWLCRAASITDEQRFPKSREQNKPPDEPHQLSLGRGSFTVAAVMRR